MVYSQHASYTFSPTTSAYLAPQPADVVPVGGDFHRNSRMDVSLTQPEIARKIRRSRPHRSLYGRMLLNRNVQTCERFSLSKS